jgi:hypothetical protein
VNKINKSITTTDIDDLFRQSGVKITSRAYNRYRNILFLIGIISITGIFFTSPKLLNYYMVLFIIYLASMPIKEFMNKKTIFYVVIGSLKRRYNEKRDMELYRLLTQLKNIAISQPGQSYTTDFIINHLLKSAELTNDLLITFLMKYRMGREDEAMNMFLSELDTPLSKDFLAVLIKIDKLSPTDLMNQINLAKSKKRESRITTKRKNQESLSNWILLPIILPVFVILLNFIMVVLWLPMMQSGFGFN